MDLSAGQVYLEIYGTGIRNAGNVVVTIGGLNVPVLSAGAQANAGLIRSTSGRSPPA